MQYVIRKNVVELNGMHKYFCYAYGTLLEITFIGRMFAAAMRAILFLKNCL